MRFLYKKPGSQTMGWSLNQNHRPWVVRKGLTGTKQSLLEQLEIVQAGVIRMQGAAENRGL